MVSETNQATLQADGDSAWVPLGPDGSVVTVDCVDSGGVSQSWGGASVVLLYSPDGLKHRRFVLAHIPPQILSQRV